MVIGVALVEPRHHFNVGYVARIMKNFGLTNMFTINASFNKEEAVKFATHGKDILASAQSISLKQLRENFDILIGTTALCATSRLNIVRDSISPTQLSDIIRKSANRKNFCIILGREASGLVNSELEICDLIVIINTKTMYTTMNISHALAILLYEISKNQNEILIPERRRNKKLASKQELDLLVYYVSKLALVSNYDKHKEPMLRLAIRRVLARALPTSKETMLLVSLVRKSLLKIGRESR